MDNASDLKKYAKNKLSNDKFGLLMSPIELAVVAAFFILTKSWQNANPIAYIVIFVLIILQMLFLKLPQTKNKVFFSSGGASPLLIYNIGLYIMLVFYLPLYSPFLILVCVIMFITIYFRGPLIMAISILNLLAIVVTSYILHGLPNVQGAKYYPFMLVILGATFAVIVQRAGAIDNKIRSELLKASDILAEEREQLNSLINGIKDSVIATDENGNIIFNNSASLKLLRIDTIKIGDPFSKLVRLYDEKQNLIDFFSLINTDKSQQNFKHLHMIGSNKEEIGVSIDISRVQSIHNDKETQGIILLIRDITKEKSLDEARDEFAAVTSHELRTPIATAEANISLAMDPRFIKGLSDSSRDRLEKAHQSVIYLADLINQLAELSNLEVTNTQLLYTKIEPGSLLREFYNNYIKSAAEKNLSMNIKSETGLEPILTSKVYLTEILENFITNAIKYTQKGSITLNVVSSREHPGNVIFSVEDTGNGIANADKDRIFHKFYRAEDYKTMQARGTGLGLYLTLKLARFIDGKIWFISELGSGSTFFIEVPPMTGKPQATTETVTVKDVPSVTLPDGH